MSDAGFEIGSHSMSHPDFSTVRDARIVRYELEESRRILEAIGGRPVTRFAVPWGGLAQCTPELLRAARAVGYERVYSHFGGRNLIDRGRIGSVLQRICSHGQPTYVRACLEGYRGRSSYVPDWRPAIQWDPAFHPSGVRRP